MPGNFERVCAIFAVRKLATSNWITDKDTCLIPDENHPGYQEFIADAIVFSLFHSSSQQTSLRRINFNGRLWDIKNEFFYMGREEIMRLADANGFSAAYEDAACSDERFVFRRLQSMRLSHEGGNVLELAQKLTRESFAQRREFDAVMPECQIMNWDCGWYQVKFLLKKCMPEQMQRFAAAYRSLSDKMRPMIYELGFLKQDADDY